MERAYNRGAKETKEKAMISVRVKECEEKIIFSAYEDDNKIGVLIGRKEKTNFFIEDMLIAESCKPSTEYNILIHEMLIKSCVNYSINRDILDLILICSCNQEVLYTMGFKRGKNKITFHIPSHINSCCDLK